MHRHSSCLVNHTNQKILWCRFTVRERGFTRETTATSREHRAA